MSRAGLTAAGLQVVVSPAVSPWECWVTFEARGRTHALLVGRVEVHGTLLAVRVLGELGHEVTVQLPRPSAGGEQVTVHRDHVHALPRAGARRSLVSAKPPSSAWIARALVIAAIIVTAVVLLAGWGLHALE